MALSNSDISENTRVDSVLFFTLVSSSAGTSSVFSFSTSSQKLLRPAQCLHAFKRLTFQHKHACIQAAGNIGMHFAKQLFIFNQAAVQTR
jgi:hypothetical protein